MKKIYGFVILATLTLSVLIGCASGPSEQELRSQQIAEQQRIEQEAKIQAEAQREAQKQSEENRLVYLPYGVFTAGISKWENSFPNKSDAEKWLADIIERVKYVDDIVRSRKELYNKDVTTFKTIPTRLTRDSMLKDKNSLIEAYNRYNPINADIVVKGVMVETVYNKMLNENFKYPGLSTSAVTETIDKLEKEYARLIDTYPVN
jgi:PHP family Zn ribbon phosphoesterase